MEAGPESRFGKGMMRVGFRDDVHRVERILGCQQPGKVVEDDGPLAKLPVGYVGKVLGCAQVAVADGRQPERVEMLAKLNESVGVAESHPAAAYQCQVKSHERPPCSLIRFPVSLETALFRPP